MRGLANAGRLFLGSGARTAQSRRSPASDHSGWGGRGAGITSSRFGRIHTPVRDGRDRIRPLGRAVPRQGGKQGCECPLDIRSLLTHAPGVARRTRASGFARETDRVVVTAVFAACPSKTLGEDATLQVRAEIPLHVAGQPRPGGGSSARVRKLSRCSCTT